MGFEWYLFPSLWTFLALALAIWALKKAGRAEARLKVLQTHLQALAEQIASRPAAPSPAEKFAAQAEPEKPAEALPASESLSSVAAAAPVASAETPPATVAEPVAAERPSPKPTVSIEQRFAARWLVWLGGLAIAIGGVLFVKYAVDNGLLPPALRCAMGMLLGAVLIAAGEFVRRTSPRLLASDGPDYVPAALTAAGLLIAFASIYAAHAWYLLIGPTTAFVAAALIAFSAFALSLLQGPLIAALGLLGAYGTPLLIPSSDPSALAFFPYAIIVLAACFAILRKRPWWWLGLASLIGALAWVMLWLHGGVFEPADQLPIGVFLLALAAIATFGIAGRSILEPESGSLSDARKASPPFLLAVAGIGLAALGLGALAHASGHSSTALLLLLAGTLGAVALAWAGPGFARLARVMGAVVFITLMVWKEAAFWGPAMDEYGIWSSALGPEASRFGQWMLVFGGLLTLVGLAGLRFRFEPIAWASLAAAAPFLFIFGSWARVAELLSDRQWAGLSAIAAALLIAAIASMRTRIAEAGMNLAFGLLTIAIVILAMFAADRLLDGIWLTLAMTIIVPLLALAGLRLPIALIGPTATAVATVVSLRLFISRELIEERTDLPWGLHWVIYGYGMPVLLLWQSSRWMRERYWRAAMALEAAALALAIALISLELRVLIAGGVTVDHTGLLEASAHILAWLGAAYGLMHRLGASPSLVRLWGARVLLTVSCLALIAVNLVALNPVVTEEALEGNIVFNALLLAYLAPAALLGLILVKLPVIGWRKALTAIGSLALILMLAYVTLETKRWFQGASLVIEPLSQGESYAYSAVWLATALLLLIAGIRFDNAPVRYGGLAFIVLTVIKVFLIDMSGLEGLYRIASFAGLGLCLVGIGYLYTRFLHRPRAA